MKPLLNSQRNQLIKFVFENPDPSDVIDFLDDMEIDRCFIESFMMQYDRLSELDKLSLDIAELIECVENEIQLNKQK